MATVARPECVAEIRLRPGSRVEAGSSEEFVNHFAGFKVGGFDPEARPHVATCSAGNGINKFEVLFQTNVDLDVLVARIRMIGLEDRPVTAADRNEAGTG